MPLRRCIVRHWEFRLSAALFLACLYSVVFLIGAGALDAAGYFLPPTFGFGWACVAFGGALDLRPRREQGAETREGDGVKALEHGIESPFFAPWRDRN